MSLKLAKFAATALALSLALGAGAAQAQEETGFGYADFLLATQDANGDGVLSRAEIGPTGSENFEDIDLDGDGAASREEIADWYLSYSNFNNQN